MNLQAQNSGMAVKQITLQTWESRYGEDVSAQLFVLNRSNPRSNIDFSIHQDSGLPKGVRVPVTFIPVDLTTSATLRNLRSSPELRRIIQAGDLVIADTQSVYELMATSERARAEYVRLYGNEWIAPDADITADLSGLADDEASGSKLTVMENEAPDLGQRYSTNPVVNIIIDNSLAGMSSEDVNTSIMNQLDLLQSEDLQVIAANVTDSSVKEFCAEFLSK